MTAPCKARDIVIAPAAREDAPAIHAMLRALSVALNRPHEIKSTPADIERFGFGDSPAFETLIARDGNEPVGLVLFFYEFSTWRGCPGVYVQDLYVAEEARGLGLGRELLAAVAARARERQAGYMRLSVHAGNEQGTGFYERLGFAASDETIFVLEGTSFAALSLGTTGLST